jgi:hypothetical protein
MSDRWLPEAASSHAHQADGLLVFFTVVVGVWLIATEALLFYAALRFRRNEGVSSARLRGNKLRPVARTLACLVCLLALSLPVSVGAADSDGDGKLDSDDVCIDVHDPAQADIDGDQYGNICDCDFDNDGFCSIADFNLFLPDFVAGLDSGAGSDMTSDGQVSIGDFNAFLLGFTAGAPGPSSFVPDGDGDGFSVAGGDCNDSNASLHPGATVVNPNDTEGVCFAARGPNGTDPRDTDGCSADTLIDVLDTLGFPLPADTESVKDDPLSYFTSGLCSAPFGTADVQNPVACDLHDACFQVCGEDQTQCNLEFFARLTETCLATYAVGTCRSACTLLADTYGIAVVAAGDSPYLHDQDIRCKCCPDTSACGDGTCEVSIGEGVANCPSDCPGDLVDGGSCLTSSDCASGHCSFQGVCTPLLCFNGSDCPSPGICNLGTCLARPLGNGSNCAINAACSSGVCNFGFCIGGGLAAGSLCTTDAACRSGDCTAGFCIESCGDGFCDGLEKCGDTNSGLECRQDCGLCSNGAICINNADCTSGVCNFGFCIGGGLAAGSPCTTDAACRSGDCFGGLCEDICGDGFCDGLEKCGDANAGFECNQDCGKCSNGSLCLSNNDCASNACNFGFCVASQSLGNGSPCSTHNACSSVNCVAGFCVPAQFCGDLSCNNGETCSTCAFDCGLCCRLTGSSCSSGPQCCTGVCTFLDVCL